MEDRGWDRIVDAIESRYGIDRHGREERKLADALHLSEKVAFIEFTRDGTAYRLERTTGPAIIDRRTVGARRAGAEIRYENVYDEHETAHRTLLYKRDGSDWAQISPDELGLS